MLAASRERILALASVIIPGHGPAFRPDQSTPR
jgi:glyoxylase-like metal-dependent hydrolase (beta-lactamase superfamily II)